MTDNHRYLIQYMLKNGLTTVENALEYCEYVSKGEINSLTQLKTLTIEINREISKQSYKLAFNTCEVTNQNLLIWVNTKNDNISKLQIKFSAVELEYFHVIFQSILLNEERRIKYMVCLNITSTLTSSFSRENGQKLLKLFFKRGYFVNRGRYVYLGPRIILEFTSYLKNHFSNSVCGLCSELVFWGKNCDSCNKTSHLYCLKKYLEKQNNCPSCHATWTSPMEDEEIEESNMDFHDDTVNSQVISSKRKVTNHSATENGPKSKKLLRRRYDTDSNNDDYSSEEEDPNEPGPSTRKRHR